MPLNKYLEYFEVKYDVDNFLMGVMGPAFIFISMVETICKFYLLNLVVGYEILQTDELL